MRCLAARLLALVPLVCSFGDVVPFDDRDLADDDDNGGAPRNVNILGAHMSERKHLKSFLATLPTRFDPKYRNPCWNGPASEDGTSKLQCIPLVSILGQPKCGTTDLYQRLTAHPEVEAAERKEVRFFTQTVVSRGMWLSHGSQSIEKYAKQFKTAAKAFVEHPTHITIDGGPHTLWWPHESSDWQNLLSIGNMPNPKMLHHINPNAKFLVAVRDPIARTVSDFRFKQNFSSDLTPEVLHKNVMRSVKQYQQCFASVQGRGPQGTNLDYATARVCIHDLTGCCGAQHRLSGRIGLGLYAPLLEPWLNKFGEDQVMVVRMEDMRDDMRGELTKVFKFLGLRDKLSSKEWTHILANATANANAASSFQVQPSTEAALRRFFAPFDTLYGYNQTG